MLDETVAALITAEHLTKMSDEELFSLADLVEEKVGSPVIKDVERSTATERRLARDLREDWEVDVYASIDGHLSELSSGDVDPAEVEALLGRVDSDLRGRDWSGTITAAVTAGLSLWAAGRRSIKELVEIKNPTASGKIGVSLTQVDRGAVNALANQQVWWIGDYWSKSLSRTILNTVTAESLKRGLGREEVGRILRGSVAGNYPTLTPPGTFRGTPEAYFRQLAGDVSARASNFSAVYGMREAEIERYMIEAVLDERTTEVCRAMHGKVFTVDAGVRHAERVLAAETPDDLKDVAGWRSLEEIRDLEKRGVDLAESGLAQPPYHANCRSTVIPA